MSVLLPWLVKEAANCMNGLGEVLLGGEKANCPPAWAGNSKSLASCKSRGSGTMDLPWSKTETLLGPRTRITHNLYILRVLGLYPSFDAPQVPTLLGVVASVCTTLLTRTQQLPTLLAQLCWEMCPFKIALRLCHTVKPRRGKFCFKNVMLRENAWSFSRGWTFATKLGRSFELNIQNKYLLAADLSAELYEVAPVATDFCSLLFSILNFFCRWCFRRCNSSEKRNIN